MLLTRPEESPGYACARLTYQLNKRKETPNRSHPFLKEEEIFFHCSTSALIRSEHKHHGNFHSSNCSGRRQVPVILMQNIVMLTKQTDWKHASCHYSQ